jgi:hypothetical protein
VRFTHMLSGFSTLTLYTGMELIFVNWRVDLIAPSPFFVCS